MQTSRNQTSEVEVDDPTAHRRVVDSQASGFDFNPELFTGFALQSTPGRGDGVFALRDFAPGEIIMVGRIVERLPQNDSHAAQIGENQWVRHAGIIHMINHCCEPNCGIRVNETSAHDVVARLAINAGEELTLDYAMRNWRIDHFPDQCRCGAPGCRGRITGWKDLPVARKREYAPFSAPYLFELDSKYGKESQ